MDAGGKARIPWKRHAAAPSAYPRPGERGGPIAPDELMREACRLAEEAVAHDWGGPFGAVVARDGEIVARGQNRVLLTGDPTAHAEIEAIRKAVAVLNPDAPAIAPARRHLSTLVPVPPAEGPPGHGEPRARMLAGMELYVSAVPCPMCLGAVYWARLDAVHYACDLEATRAIGFDDAFVYEDLARPPGERSIPLEQLRPDLGARAFEAWTQKPDRHPY